MDKETKRRVRITIIGILGLVLLIIGISFAAFSADFAGTKIQTMNTGCLKIDMVDEGSTNIANAMPETDESGLNSDPYVYSITNSCTTDAYFTTTINVMDTSNMDNVSKVKVALDGDSYLAPTIEGNLPAAELLDEEITGVSATYKLDEGYLEVGETKTFELRTWIDYDVTDIAGSLENKIIINSTANHDMAIAYNKNTAGYDVLNKNTKLTNANYAKIAPSAGEASGFVEVKDQGTTYHFRGDPNNHLIFAGKNFRVLSTNDDGSVNIVLDDVLTATTYTNVDSSLSAWYDQNVKSEEDYIKTIQTFCEDKADESGDYLAKIRVDKHNPISKCSNDSRTKIGIPTVDDLMFAGAVKDTVNTSFYMYSANSYFLSSYNDANNLYSYKTSNSLAITSSSGQLVVKPVITLNSDTKLEGEGTKTNPFYVSGKYGFSVNENYKDKIAPLIDFARTDAKWSKTNKTIEISARDNSTGSGIAGYIVKAENKTPTLEETGWEATSTQKYETIKTYDNGTYYVFARDNAGNISEGKKIVIEKVDKVAPKCTIRINPNGTTAPYKTLSILTSDKNIDLSGYSWDHTSSIEDVVKVTDNAVYTGHLTDLAGNAGSCSATVTNVILSDSSGANKPVVLSNMIPVYYDDLDNVWRKADVKNEALNYQWYDYSRKIWGNTVTVTDSSRAMYSSADIGTEVAMNDILTMQVWVPRYKYKVWNYNSDGTKTSQPQSIDITFESGTAKTGEITCTDSISGTDGAKSESCKLSGAECTDGTCNGKYYTHPAFTLGTEELPGIWVGKFELTGSINNITTKPNLDSLKNASVNAFETNIMAMNDSGNKYGFATTNDVHMMKNSEWGAVAYLSHSDYGLNGNIGVNNYMKYVTGCGDVPESGFSETCNEYYTEKGMLASTTGNVYGIYDMSGGAFEYVMGNLSSTNVSNMISGYSQTENSGYSGIVNIIDNYIGTSSYPDSKYYDKYSYGTSGSSRNKSKLGDGIKEVYRGGIAGWYGDYSAIANNTNPWFVRGGAYCLEGDCAGLFNSDAYYGSAYKNISSRLVMK